MNEFYSPTEHYKVIVRCITYNQSKYITSAMDGFVSQQTDFPFVCYINDDCSTDGQQDVIRTYLADNFVMSCAEFIDIPTASVIIARHKTNKNCTFAVYLLKQNLWEQREVKEKHFLPWLDFCEYMAYCEGDDYWIADDKLQQQVDVLDNNSKIGLVYAKAMQYLVNKCVFQKGLLGSNSTSTKEFLLNNKIPTPTVVLRLSIYKAYISDKTIPRQMWEMTDSPLWIYTSIYSNVYFLDKVFAVYRIIDNSASHSLDRKKIEQFYKSGLSVKLFFNNICHLLPENVLVNQYKERLLVNAVRFGDRQAFFRIYKEIHPHRMIIVVLYILTILHLQKIGYLVYSTIKNR